MTSTTAEQHDTFPRSACPSWCVTAHTWDGPEFHRSPADRGDLDSSSFMAYLFRDAEDSLADSCIVVGGISSLTLMQALDLAEALRRLVDVEVNGTALR